MAGLIPKLLLSPIVFTSGDNPYIAIPMRTKSKAAALFVNAAAELAMCLIRGLIPIATKSATIALKRVSWSEFCLALGSSARAK